MGVRIGCVSAAIVGIRSKPGENALNAENNGQTLGARGVNPLPRMKPGIGQKMLFSTRR